MLRPVNVLVAPIATVSRGVGRLTCFCVLLSGDSTVEKPTAVETDMTPHTEDCATPGSNENVALSICVAVTAVPSTVIEPAGRAFILYPRSRTDALLGRPGCARLKMIGSGSVTSADTGP